MTLIQCLKSFQTSVAWLQRNWAVPKEKILLRVQILSFNRTPKLALNQANVLAMRWKNFVEFQKKYNETKRDAISAKENSARYKNNGWTKPTCTAARPDSVTAGKLDRQQYITHAYLIPVNKGKNMLQERLMEARRDEYSRGLRRSLVLRGLRNKENTSAV